MQTSKVGFVIGSVVGALMATAASTLTASQASTEPQAINLPGRSATAPFSDAVLVGRTLYLAGRLGLDPETGSPPSTAEQEARNVLESIQQVLSEADMTMDNLVQVQVFCSDVSLYGVFNEVYTSYFLDMPPARAFIGSGELLFGARFEVMGTAVQN